MSVKNSDTHLLLLLIICATQVTCGRKAYCS